MEKTIGAKLFRVKTNHGRNGKNAIMENYGKLRKALTKSAFKGILSAFLFWLAFHGKHNYGKVIRSNFAEGTKAFLLFFVFFS